MCEASEILLSAYCVDGIGALHIVGTTGATCAGDPGAKAVIVWREDRGRSPTVRLRGRWVSTPRHRYFTLILTRHQREELSLVLLDRRISPAT
jgi:hypothetical protein